MGCGTPWGPTIFFSEEKSTSLLKPLDHKHLLDEVVVSTISLDVYHVYHVYHEYLSPQKMIIFLSLMREHLVYEDVGHPDEVCLAGDEVEL